MDQRRARPHCHDGRGKASPARWSTVTARSLGETARQHAGQPGPVRPVGKGPRDTRRVSRGRFAPSPTGTLHIGNLRTALAAWLFARSSGGEFLLRFEDLDMATARREHEDGQRRDLERLGFDWDGEPVRQSERMDRYEDAPDLGAAGLTYRCWCRVERSVRRCRHPTYRPGTTPAHVAISRRRRSPSGRHGQAAGRPPANRTAIGDHRRSFAR